MSSGAGPSWAPLAEAPAHRFDMDYASTIDALHNGDEDQVLGALSIFCEALAEEGLEGESVAICAMLRATMSLERLCDILAYDAPRDVHCQVMHILGNVCSTAVDPDEAEVSKEIVRDAGGFTSLLEFLFCLGLLI